MDKSKKLKRKTMGLLAKNLIVLAVLIAIALVGVRSWFTTATTATASGLSVKAELPAGLDVAIVPKGEIPSATDWKEVENINFTSADFPWLGDLNMTQVTGDGISFIKPYLEQEGTVAIVDSTSSWASNKIVTEPNVDYISFDLYMRTEAVGQKVQLDAETFCGPEDVSQALCDNEGKNISKNSVIGSTRISVTNAQSGSSEARKLLWIPAPHIYYNYDYLMTGITNTSNTYGLAVARNTNKYANSLNGTYNHTYWTSTKAHNRIAYGTNRAANVTANTNMDYKLHANVDIATLSNRLSTLSGYSSDTTHYYNKARFNIWFEGEDPEARAAQVGGELQVSLKFNIMNS